MTTVTIGAPIGGWAMPLDEVPDPVFAGRMMGDGIAIDPLDDTVRAPCDAVVSAVAPTGHSVTLLLENGAELLIHVGIDTVALRGRGFRAVAAAGDRVRAGAPLIELELDAIARGAASLVTPVLVAGEGYAVAGLASGRLVAAGDPVLSITPLAVREGPGPVGDDTARCEVVVPMAHGIHARPAARIGAALKPFAAAVRIGLRDREADARSPIGLMKLGIKRGDAITVTARGADARAAATAVAALIEGGMGEGEDPPARPPAPAPPVSVGAAIGGVRAAPGLAAGPVYLLVVADLDVPRDGRGAPVEGEALDRALASVAAELDGAADDPGGAIAAAHRAMLDDPALLEAARAGIAAGRSAGRAWRDAARGEADGLRATGDPLLGERVADLLDLERRVLARLAGAIPVAPDPPPGAVLIADDLLPSQFLELAPGRIAGIATARGGPTSHVAVLAAAAGVPMLVACGDAVLAAAPGAAVLLDADAGLVDLRPTPERLAEARAAIDRARGRRAAETSAARDPCVTADGVRIEVFANLGSLADARAAVAAGAEGCGLLRTEFLFLDRAQAPTEEEQRAAYRAIADALGDRPLIVRTLDIGGDKPVAYLPFPPEENPALGARGIRLGLARPDLLRVQLRAIVGGVPPGRCRVMLPMIVDRAELLAVSSLLEEAARAVGRPAPPLGVMVETPAAALLANDIARDAAFLSLGTNDLTQYALAADRGNPAVAARIDALHPAVLHLIARAGEGAAAHGRQLGACGALASDPAGARVLIGLGVTELSAVPAAIPAVKAAVRALTMDDARALAARALNCGTAAEVRGLLEPSRCA